jgi:hypothetical protein
LPREEDQRLPLAAEGGPLYLADEERMVLGRDSLHHTAFEVRKATGELRRLSLDGDASNCSSEVRFGRAK